MRKCPYDGLDCRSRFCEKRACFLALNFEMAGEDLRELYRQFWAEGHDPDELKVLPSIGRVIEIVIRALKLAK